MRAVRFLGVGKVSAKLLVASCTHKDIAGVDLNKLAAKMMRSSKVSRAVPPCDFRVALPGNAGFAIDLHVDGADHCFMAVTPPDYPRRMIAAAGDDTPCLINGACGPTDAAVRVCRLPQPCSCVVDAPTDFKREFINGFESAFQTATLEDQLFKTSSRCLKGLATKYSNVAELDKIRQLQARVEDVQMIMHDNLSKAVDRGEKLETVEGKTGACEAAMCAAWSAHQGVGSYGLGHLAPAACPRRHAGRIVEAVRVSRYQDAAVHAVSVLQDDSLGRFHCRRHHPVPCAHL